MSEHTITKIKPSQLIQINKHLAIVAILIIWVVIPVDYLNMVIYKPILVFHLLCIGTIIAFIYSIIAVLQVLLISYEITSERLIINTGVLNRVRRHIELYRVHDLEVVSPLYLNIFGLSNINIYSSDATDPKFTILAIKDGVKVCDTIRENVENMRDTKRVFQMG